MTEHRFQLEHIPAVLYGDSADKAYLYCPRSMRVQGGGAGLRRNWRCPTVVLYAGQDDMTGRETVERFVTTHDAALTAMENGEHWFHTPEQLAVLRAWERENI